jgi:SAM-dependent methyltransferase
MCNGPKRIVVSGYDELANVYLERFGVSTVRQKWVGRLIDGFPAGGGRVLDLGCGAGIPVARDLAALGHAVLGVDGSAQQVVRARRNVPKATFLEVDMCEVAFEVGSFHAVGAFYSITHIPPTQQGPLIANIAAWLKPGGMFVASFGSGAADEWDRRMARNHNVLWSQRRSRDAGVSGRFRIESSRSSVEK